MPTAKKLPSGSWRCQVYSHNEFIFDDKGHAVIDPKTKKQKSKRIYESFTCDDPTSAGKRTAEQMATEFAVNKERMERHNYIISEAMEKYVDSKRKILSPATIRGYNTMIKNSFETIKNLPTKKISQETIQIWANSYSANHSPKTVNNAHGFLASVLAIYEPSLRLKTKLPMLVKPDLYTPSDGDIKTLLDYVKDTEMEKAVLLASFGAMRRGEICALTDKDISGNIIKISKSMVRSNDGGFTIKSPKTTSSFREVEMPDFVMKVFEGVSGQLVKIHPEDISKNFGNTLKKAGLPHFRFHDLRHYSASIMHALGVPDQYIMQRGGWKTDRVLKQVYRNVMEEENKKFTNKINSHFESMQHDMQHENKKTP